MDNNIKALQNLYVALGGSLDDVANIVTIPEMINKIATIVPTALAGVLPAVTKTDEGKVLKVDSNGKWAVGTDEIQA